MATYQLAEAQPKPPPLARQHNELIEQVRAEILTYYEEMRDFDEQEPDEVMRKLSAFHARGCELRHQLVTANNNQLQQLRTKVVDPLLEACEFQFKVHSRRGSIRKDEWEMTR